MAEDGESTSTAAFIGNFIKSELGDDFGRDLGIERTHRSLAPKPPASAPPRSMVVRFLRFSVREKILYTAWKKELRLQNKRTLTTTLQQRCRSRERNIFNSWLQINARGTESKGISEETLAELLPWEITETRRGGEKQRFQQQIRDQLKVYRRMEPGATAGNEPDT